MVVISKTIKKNLKTGRGISRVTRRIFGTP